MKFIAQLQVLRLQLVVLIYLLLQRCLHFLEKSIKFFTGGQQELAEFQLLVELVVYLLLQILNYLGEMRVVHFELLHIPDQLLHRCPESDYFAVGRWLALPGLRYVLQLLFELFVLGNKELRLVLIGLGALDDVPHLLLHRRHLPLQLVLLVARKFFDGQLRLLLLVRQRIVLH